MLSNVSSDENIRSFRRDASIFLERIKFAEMRQLEREIVVVRRILYLSNDKRDDRYLNES